MALPTGEIENKITEPPVDPVLLLRAQEDKEHLIDKTLKFIAFPIAAASGYLTARVNLHRAAYEVEKRIGTFDKVIAEHTPFSKANSMQCDAGAIDAETYLDKAWEIKNSFSKAVKDSMERRGLEKITNQWKHINRNEKLTAVINALTVSGVAIGALLTIADNRWLSERFFKDKDQDEKSR